MLDAPTVVSDIFFPFSVLTELYQYIFSSVLKSSTEFVLLTWYILLSDDERLIRKESLEKMATSFTITNRLEMWMDLYSMFC